MVGTPEREPFLNLNVLVQGHRDGNGQPAQTFSEGHPHSGYQSSQLNTSMTIFVATLFSIIRFA
jgi:hypothetical protein